MEENIDIKIGKVTFENSKISQKDGLIMLASIFGAYRAAGKCEMDAYNAAIKDLVWLWPHLEALPGRVSLNKKENLETGQ